MIWLDKHGEPVEFIMNRPMTNFIRWLLHVSIYESVLNRRGWFRTTDGGLCDFRDWWG